MLLATPPRNRGCRNHNQPVLPALLALPAAHISQRRLREAQQDFQASGRGEKQGRGVWEGKSSLLWLLQLFEHR